MNWRREQTGWIFHTRGVPWHREPIRRNRIAYQLFHGCVAHSTSVHGRTVTERCICGGVRFGELPLAATPWVPADQPGHVPTYVKMGPWGDRNSRLKGNAMQYYPHVQPIEIEETVS